MGRHQPTGFGGGIYSDGTLTLSNSVLVDNAAGWMGGGIFSSGALTVNSSSGCTFTASIGDKVGSSASPIHLEAGATGK